MREEQEHTPYIFVSYSHADSVLASKIIARLQSMGYPCWVDYENLRVNDEYNPKIADAIEKCSIFLGLLSKNYMKAPYCGREFNFAIDTKKNRVAGFLDPVNLSNNLRLQYSLTGTNLLKYGESIETEKDIEDFCNALAESAVFRKLKHFLEESEESIMPYVMNDIPFEHLRALYEKGYRQSGNYFFQTLYSELFPAVKEPLLNLVYKNDDQKKIPLLKCLQNKNASHYLLKGEGGIGKTVSLLEVCRDSLENHIPALYVPLRAIRFDKKDVTIRSYMENMFADIPYMWEILYNVATNVETERIGKDFKVVIMFDGLNEVPGVYVKDALSQIREIMEWKNVKIIISSRDDFREREHMEDELSLIEMQQLNEKQIRDYLERFEIPIDANEKVMKLLTTPLMLTMYVFTEEHKKKYTEKTGIELFSTPDSAGKILWNFMQSQLYRGLENVGFSAEWVVEMFVAMQFAIPKIAFEMVRKNEIFQFSEEEIEDLLDDCEESKWLTRYLKSKTYRRVRREYGGPVYQWDTDKLWGIITTQLHLLSENDAYSYEFVHQNFRDYFAAVHIVQGMKWMAQQEECAVKEILELLGMSYSQDVLTYVSNILEEEKACPYQSEGDYCFPGKDVTKAKIEPSEHSVAEQVLSMLRGMEGKEAQAAVYNLVEIMGIGRKGKLAFCDFSELDLRMCSLKKYRFTEWCEEKMYPSRFDRAWIDMDTFLENGHQTTVTAVCTDHQKIIFSGDEDGILKIWDLSKQELVDTVPFAVSPIVHLVWNEEKNVLAVLQKNTLHTYDLRNQERKKCAESVTPFRYVRFKQDELQVTYDKEPLSWRTLDGRKDIPEEFSFDVPAGCAVWHPEEKAFLRSKMQRQINITYWSEEERSWFSKYPQDKISLAEETSGKRVTCIVYNHDGTRFLVSCGVYVFEYELTSREMLRRIKFGRQVNAVDYYGKEDLIVASGNDVQIISGDKMDKVVFRGVYIPKIQRILNIGEKRYLLSVNKEMKELDENMRICRIRKTPKKAAYIGSGRNEMTGENLCALLVNKLDQMAIYQYDYEREVLKDWGWECRIEDPIISPYERKHAVHTLWNRLLVVEKMAPNRKYFLVNYEGIWIFGCSFLGIQGSASTTENKYILWQNGGIVDGKYESDGK